VQWFFVCTPLLLLSFSSKAQESIDSIPEFLHFLSSIPKDETGLTILSNSKCGECLLAKDETYLEKLDSVFPYPMGTIDSGSNFGKVISMKHRINKLPAILIFDKSGQLLRRLHEMPIKSEEIQVLQLPFDTLPKSKSPLNFDLNYPKFFEQSFDLSDLPQPSEEALKLFFQMNPRLQDEVVWAVAMRFRLNDEVINRIVQERDTLVRLFGKEEVYDKLDAYFFDQMKAAVRSGKNSQFESMITKAELAFGGGEFEYTAKYKSYFFQLTGNWNAYLNLGKSIKANGQLPEKTLFEMAQILLNYSNDTGILREAAGWFSDELSKSNLENADLRAILLWRGGKETEAKDLALKIRALPTYSEVKFPYSNSILAEQK
jgi:hypothetical protein